MDAANRSILYIDYTGPMGNRVHGVGIQSATPQAQAVQDWITFVGQPLSDWWNENVITTGFRWQAQGTDFSVPIDGVPPLQGQSTSGLTTNEYPVMVGYSFRSPVDGQKTRAFLYGFPLVPPPDYRFEPGQFALADALLAGMQAAAAAGLYVTDSGSTTTVNGYTNIRYNSYWQRRYRALL